MHPKIIFRYSWIYDQNWKEWIKLNKKYKDQPPRTRTHIPLHAFHSHIYLTIFNKERLERDIRLTSKNEIYKRSWKIVQEESYKKIIKEFTKRIS
jgi:hypothetical protein